ncbi:MAG: hypothetical protein K2X64_07315 [Rhodocyclaceae bacterium]|nr:hypothetical protein [Rhodocyclaceae bacterium]
MENGEQFGFDFGDAAPVLRAMPEGTWLEKLYSEQEYLDRFARAQAYAHTLDGVLQSAFSLTVSVSVAEHERQMAWRKKSDDADPHYSLWHGRVPVDRDMVRQFIAHCQKMVNKSKGGPEYKVIDTPHSIEAGVYFPGIGSVVAQLWKRMNSFSLAFNLDRDHYFLESYRDHFESLYCDQLVWEPAYAAQTLAESNDKIVSVRTFKLGGREYVHKGASHGNGYSECDAYSIVPKSQWAGDTYTYRSMIDAFNNGTKERGDCRGLVVRVRGALCVLEKFVLVYDDQPRAAPFGSCQEDEEDPDDDSCRDADQQVDEEEAEAA